jgi:penicillin-binding protein 2
MWQNALKAASQKSEKEGVHWGMATLGAVIACSLFGLLVSRLYDLQVRRYDEYAAIAENNYLHSESINGYRGVLKDRQGAILAENNPSLNAYLYPHDVQDPEGSIALLTGFLRLSEEEQDKIAETIVRRARLGPKERVLLRQDLRREEVALLEARHLDLPGVRVEPSTKRYYPLGSLACHLIGYMKEVNAEDLEEREGYDLGDLIGRTGVERSFEEVLRGQKGWHKEVRNHRQKIQKKDIAEKYYQGETDQDPEPGNDVILTLDAELQKAVSEAFKGPRAGGAAVVDVKSGRILALYSKPGYDLNEFSNGLTRKEKEELDNDPYNPWPNRPLDLYPPGSTFKVISAIAYLENGIDPKKPIRCSGAFYLSGHRFRCHSKHGPVNMHGALAQSCDTYFYTYASEIGIDPIAKYGRLFGAGVPSDLEISPDRKGDMPDKEWYAKKKRKYAPGMAVIASIGQGDVLMTPLQLAMMYAGIANNGVVLYPKIVERIESNDGKILSSFSTKIRNTVALHAGVLQEVQAGLIAVMTSGTLEDYADGYERYQIASKTGTAQVKKIGEQRNVYRSWKNQHHAWVAAYAPYNNPQVAIAILVDHGGTGGKIAGPIALQILRRYFDLFGTAGIGTETPDEAKGASSALPFAPTNVLSGRP